MELILKNTLLYLQFTKKHDMYPAEIVIPMKEELTENGFSELLSPEDVEKR